MSKVNKPQCTYKIPMGKHRWRRCSVSVSGETDRCYRHQKKDTEQGVAKEKIPG